MAISISESRVKQVTEVVTRYVEGFRPFDSVHTQEDFLSVYDEKIRWFDHGFHVCRVGHAAVLGLHAAFLHCNQPFTAEIKSLRITTDGAAVEQLWIGRCVNDIVRPDGQVIMKASGKDFKCHVGFFIEVSTEGKITRIDEYDHRYWDEGKAEEQYTLVGAISHKI